MYIIYVYLDIIHANIEKTLTIPIMNVQIT